MSSTFVTLTTATGVSPTDGYALENKSYKVFLASYISGGSYTGLDNQVVDLKDQFTSSTITSVVTDQYGYCTFDVSFNVGTYKLFASYGGLEDISGTIYNSSNSYENGSLTYGLPNELYINIKVRYNRSVFLRNNNYSIDPYLYNAPTVYLNKPIGTLVGTFETYENRPTFEPSAPGGLIYEQHKINTTYSYVEVFGMGSLGNGSVNFDISGDQVITKKVLTESDIYTSYQSMGGTHFTTYIVIGTSDQNEIIPNNPTITIRLLKPTQITNNQLPQEILTLTSGSKIEFTDTQYNTLTQESSLYFGNGQISLGDTSLTGPQVSVVDASQNHLFIFSSVSNETNNALNIGNDFAMILKVTDTNGNIQTTLNPPVEIDIFLDSDLGSNISLSVDGNDAGTGIFVEQIDGKFKYRVNLTRGDGMLVGDSYIPTQPGQTQFVFETNKQTFYANENVTVTATLKDENNLPLANKVILFTDEYGTKHKVVDASGQYSWEVQAPLSNISKTFQLEYNEQSIDLSQNFVITYVYPSAFMALNNNTALKLKLLGNSILSTPFFGYAPNQVVSSSESNSFNYGNAFIQIALKKQSDSQFTILGSGGVKNENGVSITNSTQVQSNGGNQLPGFNSNIPYPSIDSTWLSQQSQEYQDWVNGYSDLSPSGFIFTFHSGGISPSQTYTPNYIDNTILIDGLDNATVYDVKITNLYNGATVTQSIQVPFLIQQVPIDPNGSLNYPYEVSGNKINDEIKYLNHRDTFYFVDPQYPGIQQTATLYKFDQNGGQITTTTNMNALSESGVQINLQNNNQNYMFVFSEITTQEKSVAGLTGGSEVVSFVFKVLDQSGIIQNVLNPSLHLQLYLDNNYGLSIYGKIGNTVVGSGSFGMQTGNKYAYDFWLENGSGAVDIYSGTAPTPAPAPAPAPAPGGSVGSDPHVTTIFGKKYDFHPSTRRNYTLYKSKDMNVTSHFTGLKSGVYYDKVEIELANKERIKIDFHKQSIKGKSSLVQMSKENFAVKYVNRTSDKSVGKMFDPLKTMTKLSVQGKTPVNMFIDFQTRYVHFQFPESLPDPCEVSGLVVDDVKLD